MIPPQTIRARSVSFDIETATSPANYLECESWKGEYLFKFKIPPFQRPFVWTENQCIRFIESAWLGFNLGTYMINKLEWNTGDFIPEFDRFLIDGQQRLTALKKYMDNEFKVFDLFWSECTLKETRRFNNIIFTQSQVSITDINVLEDLYERLNFGGTAHTR